MIRLGIAFLIFTLAAPALAQSAPAPAAPPARANEIALAPSRFELPIAPGEEQTVVVNVISSGGGPDAKPLRLLASLGDWTLSGSGEVRFDKAGSTPRSATPWMLYSPVELTVKPGQTHPIRVTISVPKDAPPGDHLAVLFVEERPADLKKRTNAKQLMFHFRLAAVFYIMVPPFTTKGSLTGLRAQVSERGLEVVPTLKNEGNTHARPYQSFQVLDSNGNVVLEQQPTESFPVLGGLESIQPLVSANVPPPGEYSVRYRVDFKDGGKVIEGRTKLVIPAAVPSKGPARGGPAR